MVKHPSVTLLIHFASLLHKDCIIHKSYISVTATSNTFTVYILVFHCYIIQLQGTDLDNLLLEYSDCSIVEIT